MIDIQLPTRYSPYHELILCSNRLVDVPIPLLIAETPVFLVGQGAVPIIWLSAPSEPGSKIWNYVVKEGQSMNSAVEVNNDKVKRRAEVTVGGTIVLCAVAETKERAVIEALDLRPVGLAVTGDPSGMMVGGMTLVTNKFVNVRVALTFGS